MQAVELDNKAGAGKILEKRHKDELKIGLGGKNPVDIVFILLNFGNSPQ